MGAGGSTERDRYYGYTRAEWEQLPAWQKQAVADANPHMSAYYSGGPWSLGIAAVTGVDQYGAPKNDANDMGIYFSAEQAGYRGIDAYEETTPLKIGASLVVDILFNLISPMDLPLSSWMLKPKLNRYNKANNTYTNLEFARKIYNGRPEAEIFKDYKSFRDFYMTPEMKRLYNNPWRDSADYKRFSSKDVQKDLATSITMSGVSLAMGAAMGPFGLALALAGIIISEFTTDSAARGLVETALHDNHGVQHESDFKYYLDAVVESAYKRWLEDGFWVDGKITDEGETFMWLTANRTEYEKWLKEKKAKFVDSSTLKPGTLDWAIKNNREDWLMRWASQDLKDTYLKVKKDGDEFRKIITDLRTKLPDETLKSLAPHIGDYQAYQSLREQVNKEANARVPGANLTTPWTGSNKKFEMDWMPDELKLKGDSGNRNPQLTDAMAGAWKYHSIMNADQLKDYFVKLQEGRFAEAWQQIDQIVYWSYGQVSRPEITSDVAKELGKFAKQLNVQPPVAKMLADTVQQLNLVRPYESPEKQYERLRKVYEILLTMDFGEVNTPDRKPEDPQGPIADNSQERDYQMYQYNLAMARGDHAAAQYHADEYNRLLQAQQQKTANESTVNSYQLPNGVTLTSHELNNPGAYGYDFQNWTLLYSKQLADQKLVPYLKDMYRWKADYNNNYYVKPTALDYSQIETYRAPAVQQAERLTSVQRVAARFGAVAANTTAPAVTTSGLSQTAVTFNKTPVFTMPTTSKPMAFPGP
jgi:hypothetical protein